MPTYRSALRVALGAMFVGSVTISAQSTNPSATPLRWDVISVKPMSADKCAAAGGGVGWLTDGLTASCVPVSFLVECAYRLMDQSRIVGLPDWTKDLQRPYAIETRISSDDASAYVKLTHDEQFRMLQQVLAERFQMKAHRETREIAAYDLVIAKGGQKLREPVPNELGASQFGSPDGNVKWANAPLTSLMFLLGREVGKPVIDKTGLTGKYDFMLAFTPAARADTDQSGRPSVFTALEEQLGLKLVPSKEPVDMLVVDKIEQPVAN